MHATSGETQITLGFRIKGECCVYLSGRQCRTRAICESDLQLNLFGYSRLSPIECWLPSRHSKDFGSLPTNLLVSDSLFAYPGGRKARFYHRFIYPRVMLESRSNHKFSKSAAVLNRINIETKHKERQEGFLQGQTACHWT